MYKMPEKMYLYLFIFCAVFAQGIVGISLEDDFRDSRNSLIRQKRVINRLPGEDLPIPNPYSTYTANIKISNVLHCVGNILSMRTVITAARCVFMNVWAYKVYAGAAHSGRASIHNVTEKKLQGNHRVPGEIFETGIALIYVDPPFQPIRGNIGTISLHVGHIHPGIVGIVRGWGTRYRRGPVETRYPGRLREIEVPIINHQVCVNNFRGFFEINDSYFCTHDMYKQCGETDAGAGFIIENSLAGIYFGPINTGRDSHLKPDVFIMLQHPEYYQWILTNIE